MRSCRSGNSGAAAFTTYPKRSAAHRARTVQLHPQGPHHVPARASASMLPPSGTPALGGRSLCVCLQDKKNCIAVCTMLALPLLHFAMQPRRSGGPLPQGVKPIVCIFICIYICTLWRSARLRGWHTYTRPCTAKAHAYQVHNRKGQMQYPSHIAKPPTSHKGVRRGSSLRDEAVVMDTGPRIQSASVHLSWRAGPGHLTKSTCAHFTEVSCGIGVAFRTSQLLQLKRVNMEPVYFNLGLICLSMFVGPMLLGGIPLAVHVANGWTKWVRFDTKTKIMRFAAIPSMLTSSIFADGFVGGWCVGWLRVRCGTYCC